MICWSCFSWEALATLLTGLAAIVAAVVLTKRQIEIQRRQTEIQDLLLKTTLYERRQLVRAAVTSFLYAAVAAEPMPQSVLDKFYVAMDQSRHLFGERVFAELKNMEALYANKNRLEALIEEKKADGVDVSPILYRELRETVGELDASIDQLTDLFQIMDLAGG